VESPFLYTLRSLDYTVPSTVGQVFGLVAGFTAGGFVVTEKV